MSGPARKVTVIGAGSWGTALANHMERGRTTDGSQVVLWGRDAKVLESIAKGDKNPKYLKEFQLQPHLTVERDLNSAVADAALVVVAVPSTAVREVARAAAEHIHSEALVVSGVKGFESSTHKTTVAMLGEEWGNPQRIGVLGGPSFAAEVVQGLPTALTLAAPSAEMAVRMRDFFHHNNIRVYTSTDVIGVEFGGALKNIIAVACGLIDGAGMGQNARAALITRGLIEIQDLAAAMGGDRRTIFGLAGLGDLLLTAVGDLSRNRQVGLRLARGEKLEDIVTGLGQVAEGIRSTTLALELAQKHQVDIPIIQQVERVVTGRSSVREAIQALLSREPSAEVN